MRYLRDLLTGMATMPDEPSTFQAWACPMAYVLIVVAVAMLAGIESAGRL